MARRRMMSNYCTEVRELRFLESLGLEPSYMKETMGEQEHHMAVNFYPSCPLPELPYGRPAHTNDDVWMRAASLMRHRRPMLSEEEIEGAVSRGPSRHLQQCRLPCWWWRQQVCEGRGG
ncbi:hypothetical protein SEVIR_9G206700v4 [Setaria viridis]|uniref:Uncharacterized protein n=1 Tax=Setaria viridis TaxID=4556 RepID=A0A4U6SYG1_SETVI|nr:hypothetical protein SEVIR_9G206700v2 [Setaria viridis]